MINFNSIRDILNYAIAEESRAKSLYEKLAGIVKKEDVKAALNKLALDELRHKLRLEGVRDGDIIVEDEEVGSLGIADSIKEAKPHADMSYQELLAFALMKENESYQLYTQMAMLAGDEIIREVFTQLAQEEAQHKLKLEIEYDLTTF
jgi:rubrerythrin